MGSAETGEVSAEYSNLSNALTLKDDLYKTNPSRPSPVFVETEIKYLDQESKSYYHNSIHSLQWIPAHHNRFKAHLVRSNTQPDKPLHMTAELLALNLIDRLPTGERKKYPKIKSEK